MKTSVFFYKELTAAEVGKTKTHEIYIRFPNNFDYDFFFDGAASQNGNVIEATVEAYDMTKSEKTPTAISLRFVYFFNSNNEKRMPSLGKLFNEDNVEEGDIVSLERRTLNGDNKYYIKFHKKGTIQISPTSIFFSNIETNDDENICDEEEKAESRQIIYYGAPGTGKSNRIDEQTNEDNRIRTTFHPDSDYSTFVGAYKPTMKKLPRYSPTNGIQMGEEEKITYSFVPQAFLKAYVKAWERKGKGNEEPFYLVIEEINRGNCAQIFGDLFQLLDRDDEGKSKYSICPDDDIKRYLKEVAFNGCDGIDDDIKNGEKMMLPSNLYIWATMNTSDQSLFPIDSAFKRRWDWVYVPIKDEGKKHVIEIGDKRYDWWDFVSKINIKIDSITGSEDKKLGYWFVKPIAGSTVITADQFVGKVLFYIWNDVYKDYADSEQSFFKTKDGKAPFTSFFCDDKTERLQAFMAQNDILPIEGESNDNEIEEEIGKEIPTSELRAWQQSFWTEAKSAYADAGLNVTFAPPQKCSYQLSIGITDMSLINWANKTSGDCKVGIYIEAKHGDIYYPKLLAIKNVIEEEIGFEITWKHEQGRYATIFVKKNYDLSNGNDCKAAIAWLVEKGKKIYDVFHSHIDVLK